MQVVAGEPLDDAEIEQLLSRLPDLEAHEADEVAFKRREDSLPLPLTGDAVDGEWPPDLSQAVASTTPDGPLRAVAFRPEGEVSPPFQVAVAFDRPVIEVGALGTQPIPSIQLSPEVEGRWRWLGTQTLVFEPDEQWPMATEFEIGLSEGLAAVDGTELEEELRFAFATPAPDVQAFYPRHGNQATDVPIAVVFNQAIDLASADAIKVEQEGQMLVPMAISDGEAQAEFLKQWRLEKAYAEGRVIVMSPQEEYRGNSTVTIRVQGALKSAEGPVVSMADMSSSFRVRGPLQLLQVRCLWGDKCDPRHPLQVRFSNPLDAEKSDLTVETEPPVRDLSLDPQGYGGNHRLHGDFQPRTDYRVTFSQQIYDAFGQQITGELSREFSIGPFPSLVSGPDQKFLVRPTSSATQLPMRVAEVASLRVRIFDVSPGDWDQFRAAQNSRDFEFDLQAIEETTLQFSESERRRNQEIAIDYSTGFDGANSGHIMLVIDEPEPWGSQYTPTWVYWIQHSDLGVDLSTDFKQMTAQITSIADGKAVEGAQVRSADQVVASSDEIGVAEFAVPTGDGAARPLVVEHGDDSLLIPVEGQTRWFGGAHQWNLRAEETHVLWYVLDDRQMYRPGEVAHLRGWLRTLEASPRSELQGISEGDKVSYVVREPRRNEIAKGEATIDRFGGFELDFEVPDEANLGSASIELQTVVNGEHDTHTHHVEFQEFRRPEYEVVLATDEGPHQVGESTRWQGEATYYAGGAVTGTSASWRFSESSATFQPAGWRRWSFGQWQPWWSPWSRGNSSSDNQVLPEEFRGSRESETDAQGRDEVEMTFQAPERGFPRQVEGTFSVSDVNRQSWEGTDSVLVHPASVYVGLRSEKNFISREESWQVEAIAVDIDGEVVEGRPIQLQLERRSGSEMKSAGGCEQISRAEAVSCEFSQLSPGSYQLTATVEDESGRTSESEISFWVSGRDTSGAETAEEDELVLIPEGDEFTVGDRARIYVQAPYYPLDAVVDLRRDGLYERQRIRLSEEDSVVEFDIDESMIPNVHVRVSAIAQDEGYAADHFASGSIELQVDRAPRSLDVQFQSVDEFLAPGAQADVELKVIDPSGEPVEDAQVLLFAVDESVLALSDYMLADPLSVFYPTRSPGMLDIRSRSWLLLDGEEDFQDIEALQEAATPGAFGGSGTAAPAPEMMRAVSADATRGEVPQEPDAIGLREVFDALAYFRSDLVTDAEGRVQISEVMPDSLTRYRMMAVAVDGARYFGTAEQDVTVRKPLMVRPSPPRFLNVGDSFDFPVVIHNRSDQSRSVDLAMRATSGLEWLQGAGRRVQVPADDRVEVRIAGRAKSAGTIRVQVAASSGELSDAELVSFPVLTPATSEAFATYGSIGVDDDDALLQSLQIPTDAYSEYGGLEVSASSTELQALTDAFIYLTTYRFNCSEQLASRILSVMALYDVLDAFEASELPEPGELRASMEGWIDELGRLQRPDGGFGFWPGAHRSSPYSSVHSTLALWRAREEGYEVPQSTINHALRYLRGISRHLGEYHERSAAAVESYALSVMHQMGEASPSDLDSLMGRYGIEDLPLEGLGWLLPMAEGSQFEERMLERINGQVQETAATAEFQETYAADAYRILHTTRRTDGVVLDGLMQVDPDHYLIEKVVRGLLGHRSRGRWSNTQENVFILMALRRYFDIYESVEPDFVARAWLGEEQIAEHHFSGRTTERYGIKVPMSFLHEGDAHQPLVLQRDGQGRMYYRVGMNYAPKSRMMPARDEGFTVERNYEAVDDEDDVKRTDGGWQIRAGARVRVELTMTIPARRYHVALVDWLPAGFEALNPALAVTSVEGDLRGASSDQRRWGWWGWPWYEHQNLRDERVEAFASLVGQGVHTYSYVARATTPGEFIAMPAKAEEMYHPETFGRSDSQIVEIVDEL